MLTTRHPSTWLAAPLLFALTSPARAQPVEPSEPPAPSEAGQPAQLSVPERLDQLQRDQAKLQHQLDELAQRNQDLELELVRMQADAEAAAGGEVVTQADEETNLDDRIFRGGQRALQALNPEISVVGDAFAKILIAEDGHQTEDDRTAFVYRMIGLHFQSDLDPFSFTKITAGLTPSGIGLGEAYITWTSIIPNVALTIGKFRQQFGVVNRWHLPGLDQYDWPVPMRETFGPAGLDQTGVSVEWLMPPLWADANQLVVQVTNGENGRLFAGQYFTVPSTLVHLNSYYDLSESTYVEVGLSGMVGWNNARGRANEATGELENEPWQETLVGGADWTLTWEPVRQAKYRHVVARGELYAARKSRPDEPLTTIGMYQYLETKVSRQWVVGARVDWAKLLSSELEPTQHVWGVLPYVTWWQSPWVRLRLHYGLYDDDRLPKDDHRVILQVTAAAGPHKHERY